MRLLTVPFVRTLERLVAKDISRSKKYLLVLNALIYMLAGWRSILDFQFLLRRVLYHYQNKQYGRLILKFIMDYACMSSKFFIRRFLIIAANIQWKEELSRYQIALHPAIDEGLEPTGEPVLVAEE